MTPMIKRLLHTRYRVNDLEKTVAFYRDVLGLQETRRQVSGRGSQLVFFKAPGSEEEIEIWNAFLRKRGWRDEGSADLAAAKKRSGWENRDDIQTWVDLHDVEEGRTPRT